MLSKGRPPPTEFKLHGASVERQTLGQQTSEQSLRQFNDKIPGLLGEQNIIQININDITTTALLDTGATVCTILTEFYNTYLKHVPIEQLDNILKIRCVVKLCPI